MFDGIVSLSTQPHGMHVRHSKAPDPRHPTCDPMQTKKACAELPRIYRLLILSSTQRILRQSPNLWNSAIGRVRVRGDRFHRHVACEERFQIARIIPIHDPKGGETQTQLKCNTSKRRTSGFVLPPRAKSRGTSRHGISVEPYRPSKHVLHSYSVLYVVTVLNVYVPRQRRWADDLLRHTARSSLPTKCLCQSMALTSVVLALIFRVCCMG